MTTLREALTIHRKVLRRKLSARHGFSVAAEIARIRTVLDASFCDEDRMASLDELTKPPAPSCVKVLAHLTANGHGLDEALDMTLDEAKAVLA